MTAGLVFAVSTGLVAYVFAGYPALVAAWARLRPAPIATDSGTLPGVSLIIVAYNEADVIARKLDNTEELDYPDDRLEVIVVTDGSTDATPEVAANWAGVRVLHRPERRGKLAAMNRAAALAEKDVLVFSDANNLFVPQTLRELTACFADPQVGVATGRKMVDDGSGRQLDRAEGLYWRYESRLKDWESRVGSVVSVTGEVLAFRREAFPVLPPGSITEDFVQAMSAASRGWRVAYAPKALSLERASATVGDEANRRSRLVAGRYQALGRLLPEMIRRRPLLAWQVISHKGARPLIPWALAAAAGSSLRLAGRKRWARPIVALEAAFYGLATLGWRDAARGRRRMWTYIPYYFCRMNAASLRGARDFLRGQQSAVWERVQRD